VLLLIPALALLVWAGASPDPNRVAPWTFTTTGWIVPAPSLTSLWIATALLFTLLSKIAYFLFYPVAHTTRFKPWLGILCILLLTLAPRLAIFFLWPAHLSWYFIRTDLIILAIFLLFAFPSTRRSPWWAILYLLHPLPLLIAASPPPFPFPLLFPFPLPAHWLFYALIPFLFIVAISHRFPRWLNLAIAILFAVVSVSTIIVILPHPAFNSLSAEILDLLNAPMALLPIIAGLLQTVIFLLARRRDWSLAKTLAHLLLISLICSPLAPAWAVLPLLALAPIAWTRAGWVLSLTIFAAFAAIITPKFPAWLLMLEWMPVIVLEVQELLSAPERGEG